MKNEYIILLILLFLFSLAFFWPLIEETIVHWPSDKVLHYIQKNWYKFYDWLSGYNNQNKIFDYRKIIWLSWNTDLLELKNKLKIRQEVDKKILENLKLEKVWKNCFIYSLDLKQFYKNNFQDTRAIRVYMKWIYNKEDKWCGEDMNNHDCFVYFTEKWIPYKSKIFDCE